MHLIVLGLSLGVFLSVIMLLYDVVAMSEKQESDCILERQPLLVQSERLFYFERFNSRTK